MWAVADGMGGHDAGDIASQTVVEALNAVQQPNSAAELLEECETQVRKANAQIVALSQARNAATIGTTVAVLLIRDNHFACIWAGDSRIYRATGDAIAQLSTDHTEVQELLMNGTVSADEAKHWPSNIITRAIGVTPEPELDVITGAVETGDIFILCSDGLTRHLQDNEIHQCVTTHEPQDACNAMLALALERGGLDNVTVIVVRTPPDSKPASEPTISPLVRPVPRARS
ncbi:MAG: serine/threonine-protein phosphatase [Proteobacteria bacterium]|nr:serine/threonine-protein phosphatase [Pseudomonadota bacterium]